MSIGLAFVSGVTFGLSGGLMPGPLFALVLLETLRQGPAAGMRLSVVPLLTDLPIILATYYLLSRLQHWHSILGLLSFSGAAFLLRLAWASLFSVTPPDPKATSTQPVVAKGLAVNFLNPTPYLFWLTIGTPILVKTHHHSTTSALCFVVTFYLCLIGSKLGMVWVLGRIRTRLVLNYYHGVLRLLGLGLCGFAVYFILQGIHFFK